MNKVIKISAVTLVIFILRELVILLFVAFLLTTAFLPVVDWLRSKSIPRSVSSFVLILLLVVFPIFLAINVGPMLAEEGRSLTMSISGYIDTVEERFGIDVTQEIGSRTEEYSDRVFEQVITLTDVFFRIVTGLVITLILTVYWLIYYQEAKKAIIKTLGVAFPKIKNIEKIFDSVGQRLGTWVKGQILLSIAVGLLTYLFLRILGIPYAGTLALIAGLLEFIPMLGPILAAVPAGLIAVNVGLNEFVIVIIGYIVIQQLESYLIAPKILGSTVKLNPFAILLSIIVGSQLLGIVGALIAVPVVLTFQQIALAYNTHNPSKKSQNKA
jgi:predicted PurR-regulated permease PerM